MSSLNAKSRSSPGGYARTRLRARQGKARQGKTSDGGEGKLTNDRHDCSLLGSIPKLQKGMGEI